MFLQLLGDVVLEGVCVKSIIDSGDVQRYISCERLAQIAYPGDNIDWYWKLVPFIFTVLEIQ